MPRFMQMKESVAQSNSLDKREKWESEAAMMQRFGKDEFWAHVQSGRVAWRHDPWAWGVVNYCDKGDLTLNTQVKKSKAWSRGQEYEPTEEEDAEFDGLWNLGASGHLQQVDGWGKGKSNAFTKGKGQGGGKGKKGKGDGPLAIKDRDDEDGEKARRMTKAGKKDTEDLFSRLSKKMELVKVLLVKKEKSMALSKAKALLVEAAALLKEVKDEAKELNQLANRAGSKASKR